MARNSGEGTGGGGGSGDATSIQGVPVDPTAPTNGQVLEFNGTLWLPATNSPTGALLIANNLSDVASASASRTNLGLGTAATHAAGDFLPNPLPLPSGDIIVGNGGGAAANVAMSGDATISNAGVLALKNTGPGATGPIGDGAHVSQVTIDAQGRVTALASVAITGGGGGSPALVPTAVKTANYTAAASDWVPCDASAGSFTITLPTAPADGTVIGIEMPIRTSPNLVTVAAGGTDVFDKAAGTTTKTLYYVNQSFTVQYKASSGIWYTTGAHLPNTAISSPVPHLPSGAVAATFDRYITATAASVLTSGTIYWVMVRLTAGTLVTSITLRSGSQGAVAPTHQFFGIANSSRVVQAWTSDDTSTAWGATTNKTLNLTTPFTAPTTDDYYIAVMVAAGTVPNINCASPVAGTDAIAPIPCGPSSDTGITTPPALPFTGGTITTGNLAAYAWAS